MDVAKSVSHELLEVVELTRLVARKDQGPHAAAVSDSSTTAQF